MSSEITKDTVERWLFKLLLLALVFAAGIGANALGGAIYWFISAGAAFLLALVLYIFNVGRLRIRAKDANDLTSQIWGRQFVNLLIITFGFGSGIAAGYLGAGGLWRYTIGAAIFTGFSWFYVKGKFKGVAAKVSIMDPKKPKKEKPKKEPEQ
jgi:uncharacterized membrane protein YfcA